MTPTRLSFIVFGVPRSGTKALARALNLHPRILCASERIDHRADHSRIDASRLLEQPRSGDRLDRRKHLELRATDAGKPGIAFVGNKDPRYYLALDRINAELPGLRNLVVHRSPYAVIPSWNRKETAHRETRWPAGATGLYAFLELIVCLQSIVRRSDVFVFPYELGLNEGPRPILEAVDFIGADPGSYDEETFAAALLPKRVTNPRRIPLEPFEREFLECLDVRELDEVLARSWGPMTPSLSAELGEYLRRIRPRLPRAIDEAFGHVDRPVARAYGARYIASNRTVLAGLLELTQGSEVMADLLRYGPARRLRYAFAQRDMLRRRLAAIRPFSAS